MLLDETDLPVLPLREQVHEFVEIIGGAACGEAPQSQQPDAECAPHHEAGSSVRARQKSKKLNQLYGSLRQYWSSSAA